MNDIKFICDNEDIVKANLYNRGDIELYGWHTIDRIIFLNTEIKELITINEKLRAEKNKLGKNDQEQAIILKNKINKFEIELSKLKSEFKLLMSELPNMTKAEVPGSVLNKEIYCNPKTGYRFSDKQDIFTYFDYLCKSIDIINQRIEP